MLRGELNAMKKCARCNGGLAIEVSVIFIAIPLHFYRKSRKAPFVEEKSVMSPEMPLRSPAAWVLPGEFNAMRNCARCKGGLSTLSSEVNVRFISLLSPFDCTQSPVYGVKGGQVT